MSTIHYDITKISGVITTSGKQGEFRLPDGLACIVEQIIVLPAISNNMYRVDVINVDDNMSMWGTDAEGKVNYTKPFPIWGNYKVKITSASSDDVFNIVIIYR